MKRVLICILSMFLLFQLSACKEDSKTSSKSQQDTVTCPSCDEKQDADASFCTNCGEKISSGSKVKCANCGSENPAGSKYCGECSSELANSSGTDSGSNGSGEGSAACIECAGNGLDECAGHKCLACDGVGYSRCPTNCNNGKTPYGDCYFCENGYIDCFNCENGLMYFNTPYNPDSSTASESCSNCENGYVQCPQCDGSGRSGSYTVGGFDGAKGAEVSKTCSNCHGRKKIQCSVCGGDGEL